MRIKILLFVIAITVSSAMGQSLGVGTPAPNPKAVLHVESPTNNQGFIMPRLTTVERVAISLSASDNGLMVYDTDLKAICIWSGTTWVTSTQGAAGPKLQYPYKDSVILPTGTNDLLALKYNNPEPKRLLRIESLNATNGSSALSVRQDGTGLAGFFQGNNQANGGTVLWATTNSDRGGSLAPVAIYGESTGTGSLGAAFWNTNPANNYPALYTRTLGAGHSVAFETINEANSSAAVRGFTNGTGNAGQFIINNGSSAAYALAGETNGAALSAGVFGGNTGNGFGVYGKSAGTVFGSAAVYGEHTGTGDAAGAFRISNSGNTFSALYGETNGSGPAVYGKQIGNTSGHAGLFQAGDATNTAGTGIAVFGSQFGLGRAGQFQITNAANAEVAIRGFTNGTGRAGYFNISNPSNVSEAFFATTNGLGSAGNFTITNATSTSPALNVETNGAGFGVKSVSTGPEVAGYFQTSNASSITSTLFSLTNAPGGVGVGTINTANGLALGIFQGGMKVSTHTLSVGTTITTRAIAYNITGGGPYTFSLTPGLTDGEMFFFYNTTGAPVTVAGAAIPPSSGLLFIVLGGVPRPF
jgi:hypothetical protein